ncbi:MAG: Ribosomal RNA-processing protein 7 [Claussenomyces sp. TS43310]|nr:MAG: Ribosomal RNA-processing protein 7 [Claussenomyces sp. TS43310]
MSPQMPATIAGYSILPISFPPTSAYPVQVTHYLYLRPHAPKVPTPKDDRSIFLVNVPVDSTAAHFRAIFATLVGAGRFENITFERDRKKDMTAASVPAVEMKEKSGKKRKRAQADENPPLGSENAGQLPQVWDRALHGSGSSAVVIMVDAKSVEAVFKAVRKVQKSEEYPVWGVAADGTPVDAPPLGSQRYLTHHALRYPDKAVLEASVDAFMTAFNRKEEEMAQAAKRARNVPDEDGFVTVSRGGRTGPARREEAEEARRKEHAKEEEKKRTMGDFYRFQGRERRKAEQGELARRFEEDRKRVENMRKERRSTFRPE